MKFIDDAGVFARKSSGLYLLIAGITLSACSSMKDKPTAASPTGEAAPTASAEEISSEPDLEKLARERAAKGETRAREGGGKVTAAAEDTSAGPEVTVTLDANKKALAANLTGDYERALSLMKQGNAEEAYALLEELQGKAPAFSGPLLNQALIRLSQKKPADALERLKKAAALNDKNPYVWNLTGYAEKQLGHFKLAKEAYEKALALSPNYGKAHFNLAVLSDLYLQDLPNALKHYEAYQALQSKPDATVAKWIVDLQKRTGVYKAPAKKAATEEITEEQVPAATPGQESQPASATPAATDTQPPAPTEAAPASTPAEGSKP